MEIIAVVGPNGGAGRTTVTHELGASLAAMGKRVLAVELNFGMLTPGFPREHTGDGTAELLAWRVNKSPVPVQALTIPSRSHSIDVIRANHNRMFDAQALLRSIPLSIVNLPKRLAEIATEYDYAILDCPHAIDYLSMQGIFAADWILCTMRASFESYALLKILQDSIQKSTRYNPRTKILGAVVNQFQINSSLHNTIVEKYRYELSEYFPFIHTIRFTLGIELANCFHVPMTTYRPAHPASKDIIRLAKTVVETVENLRLQSIDVHEAKAVSVHGLPAFRRSRETVLS